MVTILIHELIKDLLRLPLVDKGYIKEILAQWCFMDGSYLFLVLFILGGQILYKNLDETY